MARSWTVSSSATASVPSRPRLPPCRRLSGSGPQSKPVRISAAVGQVVYALIAIVVAIAALDILKIPSISEPASQMLRMRRAEVRFRAVGSSA